MLNLYQPPREIQEPREPTYRVGVVDLVVILAAVVVVVVGIAAGFLMIHVHRIWNP